MIILITVLLTSIWNSSPMISAIRGVATLKVVAVPASSAKTARRSISILAKVCIYLFFGLLAFVLLFGGETRYKHSR